MPVHPGLPLLNCAVCSYLSRQIFASYREMLDSSINNLYFYEPALCIDIADLNQAS